jgi:dihydroflavonol-4-reductase
MVHVASIHIFERVATGTIDETIPLVTQESAVGIYDYTKAEAVRMLWKLVEQGLDVVIACPTGVVGPNDYYHSEAGKIIQGYMAKSMHIVPEGGYDWVDVRDIARGLINLAAYGSTGELYILGGHYISIGNLAQRTRKILDKPVRLIIAPYPLLLTLAYVLEFVAKITRTKPALTPYSLRTVRDNTNISHQKAVDAIGYSTRPVAETLSDMIAWYAQ